MKSQISASARAALALTATISLAACSSKDEPVGSSAQPLTFPTNWELSTARSTTVVRFLQDQGIDPAYLSAAGYSEYRPVDSNETDEGKAKNRRIEIVLIPLEL